jgi:hypothetical protein
LLSYGQTEQPLDDQSCFFIAAHCRQFYRKAVEIIVIEDGIGLADGLYDLMQSFEIPECPVVVAVNASQNGKVPNSLRIGKQVNVAGRPRGLDAIWGRSLKLTRNDTASAELKYGPLPVARRSLIGHLYKGEPRALNLSPLLLAVCLIVAANALKIICGNSKHRLAGPFDHFCLAEEPGASSDGCQLTAQRLQAFL